MTEYPTDPQKREALRAFLASVTVPILYYDPKGGGDQIGTGTLFTVAGRLFLVTAAHLFKDHDPAHFSIPSVRTTELWSLGRGKLLTPRDDAFDIAVFELHEEATIARAKASWRILTLANIGPASLSGVFVLCGFPSERAERRGDVIRGSRVVVFSERIEPPENVRPPAHPAVDLFFHYRETVDGTKTPNLGGCSGASIYEYREPRGTAFWMPERCLTIVGVQSACLERKYFRAKSWAVVLEIMRKCDDDLAAIISEYHASARAQGAGNSARLAATT
jgi:hypothetical protein